MARNKPLIAQGRTWFIVSLTLLSLIVFSQTYIDPVSAKDTSESDLYKELKVFTDVLSVVQKDYVRTVDNQKIVEGAIKGMLTTLDPHSGYFDPDFYKELEAETKGEFGGLGIEITIKNGLLVVVAPMEGSPAEKVGVRAGDSIVKIGGKFVKEVTLVDAVKRLRGPKGTPVQISVLRKGASDMIDFTIVRDDITVRSVRGRYINDGYGYIRINQFVERTAEDLKSQLDKITRESGGSELKGLVLDLRNNPGGLLAQAIQVSDLFLNSGVIVYTDGRIETQKQKFFAHPRGTEPAYPIIVLVNGGSASASEIVAGALKDHGRALVLGTKTFGKGSVQTVTRLENGGALKLTTALYYTKSGHSLQGRGVTPDIFLDFPPPAGAEKITRQLMHEGDLPGAIENPDGKPDAEMEADNNKERDQEGSTDYGSAMLEEVRSRDPEKDDLGSWVAKDIQLARAIELLKTYNIFSRDTQPT